MEYKSAIALNDAPIDGRKVTGFVAIMGNIDDGGDRIFNGAFKKTIKERAGRVKHLWAHDMAQPPIATILELKEAKREEMPSELLSKFPEVTGGLRVQREYLNTPRGDEILTAIQAQAITEMSFGYDAVKFDFEEVGEEKATTLVRNLREVRLWDTSDVNWGMNSLTLAASKRAIPYKDTGDADEATTWSAPSLGDFTDETWETISAAERTRILSHFAYSINWPPETFGDLKLPHHQAGKSGIGKPPQRGQR